jgi:Raf kinase inhibitor-like YbhB/YbcL family protein
MKHTVQNDASMAVHYLQLKVTSPAFNENEMIPVIYTCEGANISPPLDIAHIPVETQCLALIVDDPDAPAGTWVHWVVWNMPVTHHIKANEVHGMQGINDFHRDYYGGPCPPSGTHRYFFKVYALDALLDLPVKTRKEELETAMSEHIIGFGRLVGLYQKTNKEK